MIEKYLLRLDNCDYADVSYEQNSYIFSMCEPGTTYTFQMQVCTRNTKLFVFFLVISSFSSFPVHCQQYSTGNIVTSYSFDFFASV